MKMLGYFILFLSLFIVILISGCTYLCFMNPPWVFIGEDPLIGAIPKLCQEACKEKYHTYVYNVEGNKCYCFVNPCSP